MTLLSTIQIALSALRANRFRSFLTMLGIIIGVAAVIAMMAVGSGATASVEQEISSIGSNLLIVLSGTITSSGIRLGSGQAVTLTSDDANAIAAECPAVLAAAPTVRGGAQVVYGNSNWATSIQGVTPDFLLVRDLSVAEGSAFTDQDVDSAAKVALLGPTVVQNLFGSADPVGQVIRIKNVPFVVDGVLAPKGQSPMGQDQDDVILLPLTTARRKVLGFNQANANAVGAILVQARDTKLMNQAQQEVTALLHQRHHIQAGQEDDFSVRNLTEILAARESSARIMSILLGAIASVSLVVGGIGIMNIMMVSVTERTKEIGLRLAIGARKKNILTQFLVESVTLSAIGGAIGILLGLITSVAISAAAHWATLISPLAVALAFVFSGLVGVFFGYYPARRAATLDPIESLRYE
jgi:putative ABC transport system permease protein